MKSVITIFLSLFLSVFSSILFAQSGNFDKNWHSNFMIQSSGNDYWHALNEGVDGIIRTMVVHGDDLFIAGNFNSAGNIELTSIVRYNLTSQTWHDVGDIRSVSGFSGSIDAMAIHDNDLYIGGTFSEVNGMPVNSIVRYNIENDTWHDYTDVFSTAGSFTIRALLVNEDELFVGGTFGSIYGNPSSAVVRHDISENSWHIMDSKGDFWTVNTLAIHGDDLFVGGSFSDTYFTNNVVRYNLSSGTWHKMDNGFPGQVKTMKIHNSYVYVGGPEPTKIKRYHIENGSWESLGPEGEGRSNYFLIVDDDLYVGGNFSNLEMPSRRNLLMRYNINSNSWHQMGDGVIGTNVHALVMIEDELYVGGLFYMAGDINVDNIAIWNTQGATNIDNYIENPIGFYLSQNYPNPFNPGTVISYRLPMQSDVTLEVYDMIGRRVAVLENGMRSAGLHEVYFNASDLSSGMYIYRITAGEFMETRTMMLVK